ncbi:transmembrane gamma-carboxyglutamic acid protein 3 isoform X2 [Engraulis encrasicolus]
MEFWKMRSIGSNAESRSDGKDVVFMVVPLLVMTLLALIGLFLLWRCQLQKTMRRRWPAYPQHRYLSSHRNSRSLPRILVHRDSPVGQSLASAAVVVSGSSASSTGHSDNPHHSHHSQHHHHHHHHHHAGGASSSAAAAGLVEAHSGRPTVVISGVERGGSRSSIGSEHILTHHPPPNGHALYVKDSSASVASRLSGATPPPSYEEVTGHAESSSDETSAPYSDPPPKYDEIVRDR